MKCVKTYLDEEINFVRKKVSADDILFEIRAGYGRIMKELAPFVKFIYGIDIAKDTVVFGQKYLESVDNCHLSVADVYKLEDIENKYDVVLCMRNGLSTMKGDTEELITIAMRMLQNKGKAYFSTYSPKFWKQRLVWFEEQANKGLLGEINYEKTSNGVIVCKDGFMSTTYTIEALEKFGKNSGYAYYIEEVDESSLFLVIEK